MKTIMTMGVCLLAGIQYVFGQQGEAPDTVVNDLQEIIVSANRWGQTFTDVPMKVQKINAALVEFQNPQTAADLLSLSDNVFVQKSQLGGGSPIIRGFATNRVLLVVDGVRMNNAIFRSGNVQNVISLDPNMIESTEVVFGPGAVLYGSDAIGGVMSFNTFNGQYAENDNMLVGANALARYSSANQEKTGHIDFNIGLKKWSFLTSLTRSVYDDLRMGSDGPEEYLRPDFVVRQNDEDVILTNDDPELQKQSGYNQWNGMQKISFRPTGNTEIVYGFNLSQTSDYPRYDRLILREDGQLSNAEWYYGPQKWTMHSLTLKNTRTTSLFDRINFVTAFQDYQESRHNRGYGSARRTDRREKVRAFSTNLDLEKKLGNSVTFFYGAEYLFNKVNSIAQRINVNSGEVEPTSTRYPDGAEWTSVAGYTSVKFVPSKSWVFNASARYTSVYTTAEFDNTFFDFPFAGSSVQNGSVSGSLGVVYHKDQSLKVYANVSSGFRAPNVDDIGKVFDSEPGNVVVPNPTLRPEQAYNAELGVVTFPGSSFKVDLAGYYTVLENAIARGVATFNGQDSIDYDGVLSRVLSQQNISDVWVTGIQAAVQWELTDALKLSSSLNVQKGRENDPEIGRDVPPTHVVPTFGATHLVYRRTKLTMDLYSNYNSTMSFENLPLSERGDAHLYARDVNGDPFVPAWWTLNLKGQYFFNDHLDFSLGIENIFNKRYRPYSSGITAPGRNFIISLRAHF